MLFAIQRDASVPVKGSLVYLVCDLMKLVGPFGGHCPCDHHAAVDEAEFDLRGPSGDTLQFTEHSTASRLRIGRQIRLSYHGRYFSLINYLVM